MTGMRLLDWGDGEGGTAKAGRRRRGEDAMAEGPNARAVPARRHEVLVDELTNWLMQQALSGCRLESLLTGVFDGLIAAGLPVARGNIGLTTLHPLFETLAFTWTRESGLETERFAHGSSESSPQWKRSPLHWLTEKNLPLLRRHLSGPEAMLDFPLLEDLAVAGYTDYLAWFAAFERERIDGAVGSFATRRPGGFTEGEVAALRRVQARLAVALKVVMREQLARNVLSAYLGEAAAERVLDGQIRRGDGQRVEAAIWYSDLRGSTALAERVDPQTYLETLDAYFEATAGAVMAEGGQVLLLIGDAVLAIFPVEGAAADTACAAAVAAARRALADMAVLNRERAARGAPTLRFGLGLHLGELLFGNIGTRERLEFTAVGRAVNRAARLEEASKMLECPVVASADFVARVPGAGWQDLGRRRLRGLEDDLAVAALRPDPSADADPAG